MSAPVTHVWTVEPAPTKWMASRVAVFGDSLEQGVKQVGIYKNDVIILEQSSSCIHPFQFHF